MGVQVGWPQTHPFAPHSISSSQELGCSSVCFYPLITRFKTKGGCGGGGGGGAIARSRLTLPKGCAIINIRTCRASLYQFSGDGFIPRLDGNDDYYGNGREDDHKNAVFKIFENSRYNEDDDSSSKRKMGFSCSKEVEGPLRPSWFEIWPEPSEWPGSDEIIQASIERKAVRFDIPMSLRIIKKRKQQQLEEGVGVRVKNGGEINSVYSSCTSVNKAFSSMVSIIRELQSYTFTSLQMKENIVYYTEEEEEEEEEEEDRVLGEWGIPRIPRIPRRVHTELHASFVWLFQQVFSKTPTLMLYLMILLANCTLVSLSVLMDNTDNNAAAATPSPIPPSISYVITETETETETFSVMSETEMENQSQSQPNSESLMSTWTTKPVPMMTQMDMDTEEEVNLWNSLVEEASRMAWDLRGLDHDTIQRMVSPVGAEIEADDYIEYFRTDLQYQIRISDDPQNPLLLSNYGHFLRLFPRDHHRAEECFKRALEVEPQDGEALSRYANFLWIIRKDLWAAEERFLQAMAADPGNPYHVSNYATFLWNTGGGDICFPLQSS